MNELNRKWMEQCWKQIYWDSMSEVIIPGTHNSGSFSGWLTPIVRCQNVDIGEQLDGGVRYFDLRVTIKNDGSFVSG